MFIYSIRNTGHKWHRLTLKPGTYCYLNKLYVFFRNLTVFRKTVEAGVDPRLHFVSAPYKETIELTISRFIENSYSDDLCQVSWDVRFPGTVVV